MIIEQLLIKNFRRFDNFTLRLREGNVLVGPNNVGKSSILDAFRLLDACYRHSRTRNPRPLDFKEEGVFYGYEIPDNLLPFDLANITTNYSEDDAIIEFRHSNKARAILRLHPRRVTRFCVDAKDKRVHTSSKFRHAFPFNAVIVPTLAPLEAEEAYVVDETVKKNASTRLASRVLRNVWLRESDEEFDKFSQDIEAAWEDITISKPELRRSTPRIVEMFYSESRLDREVQWAGFGFQVWLQMQTHLRRGDESSLLIIDEPDIYLHPDLQRRLLRSIRKRYNQFIMATHSVEIVNDAHANEIVSINPKFRTGKRINTEDEYTAVYRALGSADNADFARIARVKRVIFVEGRDAKTLRRIATRLGFVHLADPQGPPAIQLGGFSNSPRAAHAIWAFRQVLDMDISGFCMFDRDYRCDEEIEKFLAEWNREEINAKVLRRKEMENYLLIDSVIQRAISARLKSKKSDVMEPTRQQVLDWLLEAAEGLKTRVLSQRAAHVLQYAKESGSKLAQSTLLEKAMTALEGEWRTPANRLRFASGKEILARFNDLLQERLKISLTEAMIVDNLGRSDVDPELLAILGELDAFCEQ
jgi:energy-coupling factor transporter ATP-binding protein EcfA2